MKQILLPIFCTAFFVTNVNAGIIFEQTALANSVGGNGTFTEANTWGAEDFTISDTFTIESLGFWGATKSALGPSADWRIYMDNSGLPGTVVSSGTVSGANYTRILTYNGNPYYTFQYTLDVVDFVLGPGSYWVAFQPSAEPDTSNTVDGPHWMFANSGTGLAGTSGTNGFSAVSFDNGNTWANDYGEGTNNSENWAFQIQGTAVPVPAAIWLFGSAVIGLVAGSGKRNRKKPV